MLVAPPKAPLPPRNGPHSPGGKASAISPTARTAQHSTPSEAAGFHNAQQQQQVDQGLAQDGPDPAKHPSIPTAAGTAATGTAAAAEKAGLRPIFDAVERSAPQPGFGRAPRWGTDPVPAPKSGVRLSYVNVSLDFDLSVCGCQNPQGTDPVPVP